MTARLHMCNGPLVRETGPFWVLNNWEIIFSTKVYHFGLAVATREWQMAIQAVVKYIRQKGATIWAYLDDISIWIIVGIIGQIGLRSECNKF